MCILIISKVEVCKRTNSVNLPMNLHTIFLCVLSLLFVVYILRRTNSHLGLLSETLTKHTNRLLALSKYQNSIKKFIEDFVFLLIWTQERTTSNNSISNMTNLNQFYGIGLFFLLTCSAFDKRNLNFSHMSRIWPWMKSVQVTYFTKYENTIESYISNHLPDFFDNRIPSKQFHIFFTKKESCLSF